MFLMDCWLQSSIEMRTLLFFFAHKISREMSLLRPLSWVTNVKFDNRLLIIHVDCHWVRSTWRFVQPLDWGVGYCTQTTAETRWKSPRQPWTALVLKCMVSKIIILYGIYCTTSVECALIPNEWDCTSSNSLNWLVSLDQPGGFIYNNTDKVLS